MFIFSYIRGLLCPLSHAIFRTILCVLRTHIESRFCNPHVLILLNLTSSSSHKGTDDIKTIAVGVSDEAPGFSDRRRRRSMSEDDSDDEGTNALVIIMITIITYI
jgi:hypothetical protein